VRHIWESYKKGVIRDIYFRQDRLGVAISLERNCAGSLKPMMSDEGIILES
jgi:hypothetical protein